MPKQPNAQAGSSNRGKIVKVIPKTSDMVHKSGGTKAKGKERGVFGDLDRLVSETRKLPKALLVEQFAKTRALEILAFQNAIKSAASQGSTRVFQSLPRHLRRRAASHNPRRVPKRLRSRAAVEIDAGDNTAKIHRKRAKLRAKGNLRQESRTAQLQRRQINKQWLPTHMYHAKRFHMTTLWGYRIALTPTLKSFRPAWRASKRKCIVSDTSYFGTIELEGGRGEILEVLGRMTGNAFAGGRYETGARIAETALYRPDAFPMGMIGPAEILWCPAEEGDRKVWVRVHPSIFTEVFDSMKDSIAEFAGSSAGVRLRDKRDDLGSFDIVGPKGGRLLRRILRICRDEAGHKRQLFASLDDPSVLPAGAVMGLRIYDPRLHFPPPALPEQPSSATAPPVQRAHLIEPSAALASSSLWDEETCEELIHPKFKKSDLDKRRHDLALPGTRLRPLAQDDRIPVILVAKQNAFKLLFPRGWAQPLLHSVVYTATMLGGLEERRAQHREAGVPCFPEQYGNVCDAGREFEVSVAKEDERRWSRKPPGKRIDHPTWTPEWEKVLRLDEEESMSAKGVWLLPSALAAHADKAEGAVNAFRKARGMAPLPSGFSASAVVHVKLEVEGRGSPGRMAEIHALGDGERAEWIEAVCEGADRLHDGVSHAQLLGEQGLREDSLAGYTNTGNFSMSRGCGFALGTVTLKSWVEAKRLAEQRGDGRGVLFKVRNNGGRICRLAKVELV